MIQSTTPNIGSKPLFKTKPPVMSGSGFAKVSVAGSGSATKPGFGSKPGGLFQMKKPNLITKKKFEMKEPA